MSRDRLKISTNAKYAISTTERTEKRINEIFFVLMCNSVVSLGCLVGRCIKKLKDFETIHKYAS